MTINNIESDPVDVFLYYRVGAVAPLTLVVDGAAKLFSMYSAFTISISTPGLQTVTGEQYYLTHVSSI